MKRLFNLKYLILLLGLLLVGRASAIPEYRVSGGKLRVIENFKSDFIASREIYVWTPDDYSPNRKYPVVYMHDGQMLWDATVSWNKQEWQIDEVASRLFSEGKCREFIVVGIPSHPHGERFYEYFPQKSLQEIDDRAFARSEGEKSRYCADEYLKFMVRELKPYIDSHYSTSRKVKDTFVMGSSMGGLMSLYALCEYPDIFGGAGCLSTHAPMVVDEDWLGDEPDSWAVAFRKYLDKHLPQPNSRLIYMDRGDRTLDSTYKPFQDKLNELIRSKGWDAWHFTTRTFPGAAHCEEDWARRVAAPLQFLLPEVKTEREIRVEPEMWWCGMKDPELQLMVYGPNIASYIPSVEANGVFLRETVACESPNYMILYLDVAQARPGVFKINFKGREQSFSHDYELKERIARASRIGGFDASDVLYLIMPDRFANGDPSNDRIEMRYPYRFDRKNGRERHGGDLLGIERHLDYFTDLGVTALWLNPVLENDMGEMSYHGYAATDYYNVDARLGGNEAYCRLIDQMHQRGLKVVMDMVFNHCGSKHPWALDLPMRDWFNNPFEYVQTNHCKQVFYDPYAADIDRETMTDGWFVPTMPDLNQRNPHVAKYLIQNSIWWIEYARIDGIRQDTYPYADKQMMEQWCRAVFEEYPDFNIVGESWIENPVGAAYWQRKSALNPTSTLKTTMDFHLQSIAAKTLAEETTWNSGMNVLYDHFTLDCCYPDVKNVLRFLENHDTDRFFSESPVDTRIYRQGLVLLLTIPGIPQLYYGQEFMQSGTKGHDDAFVRMDMPGGWDEDPVSVFDGSALSPVQKEAMAFARKILKWRRGNNVIARGEMKHFKPRDGVYVYERRLGNHSYMMVLNGTDCERQLDLTPYGEVIRERAEGYDVLNERSVSLWEVLSLKAREALIIELK